MIDIVEKLRDYKPYRLGDGEWFGPKHCTEAADEITALRARVKELEGNLRWWNDRRFALQSKFDLHGPPDLAAAMRKQIAADSQALKLEQQND